jgi:predicted MFS family arabinose efflux permease
VFYVNIPIGIVALIVVAIVLPKTMAAARPIIDYAGIALLAGAATCVVLVTSFAGSVWPWDSAQVIAGIVGFLVFVVGFILVEQRVREPVMPLRLFRNRVFSASSVIGFVVGFAMFGAITFLPLYMQRVQGVSATESGLRLLPMMGGLLLTSLASGQIISRTGRYKLFPILGCGCFTVGLFLLSLMDKDTGVAASSLYMFVLGVGLGMVMQVLVLAVQNAVEYRDLGTATSAATFFRTIGSCIGVAAFGTVFTTQLTKHLAIGVPPTATGEVFTSCVEQLIRSPGPVPCRSSRMVHRRVRDSHPCGVSLGGSGWNGGLWIGVPAARGSAAHRNAHQRPRRGVRHPNVAHLVGRAAASAVSTPQSGEPIAGLRAAYPTGERRS